MTTVCMVGRQIAIPCYLAFNVKLIDREIAAAIYKLIDLQCANGMSELDELPCNRFLLIAVNVNILCKACMFACNCNSS